MFNKGHTNTAHKKHFNFVKILNNNSPNSLFSFVTKNYKIQIQIQLLWALIPMISSSVSVMSIQTCIKQQINEKDEINISKVVAVQYMQYLCYYSTTL